MKPLSWDTENALRHRGFRAIAGIDEAGRGTWAGPVVACAVIFSDDEERPENLAINDSKKVTPLQRAVLEAALLHHPKVIFALGSASVEEIDQLNILQASLLAMRRAVAALSLKPDYALVDGRHYPLLDCPGEALIGGDGRVVSIAAASILAKEHRDRMMRELDLQYPPYGFQSHKGYGTADHREALARYGPCPLHRRSFAPVRLALATQKKGPGGDYEKNRG
jgi:ribonuclease HII